MTSELSNLDTTANMGPGDQSPALRDNTSPPSSQNSDFLSNPFESLLSQCSTENPLPDSSAPQFVMHNGMPQGQPPPRPFMTQMPGNSPMGPMGSPMAPQGQMGGPMGPVMGGPGNPNQMANQMPPHMMGPGPPLGPPGQQMPPGTQANPQFTMANPVMRPRNPQIMSVGPMPPGMVSSGTRFGGPTDVNINMPGTAGRVYPPEQPVVFNPANPNAPPIYPCGICHKEVHDNDQAILCESGCNFWFHRICTGLSVPAFEMLHNEIYAEWVCDKCLSTKNIPLVKMKP